VPPAGNGTTIVTGRLGHACAEAARGDSSMAAIANTMTRKLVVTAELTGDPRSDLVRFRPDRCLWFAVHGSRATRGAPDGFAHGFRIGALDVVDRAAFDRSM
jgi:hypothetical protein